MVIKYISVSRHNIRSKRGHGGIIFLYIEQIENAVAIISAETYGILTVTLKREYFGWDLYIYIYIILPYVFTGQRMTRTEKH